jgi:hypothetical protein
MFLQTVLTHNSFLFDKSPAVLAFFLASLAAICYFDYLMATNFFAGGAASNQL